MSYDAIPPRSPYANPQYNNSAPSPYANSQHNNSTSGFIQPTTASQPRKRGTSNWIKFGIPVVIIIIAAAVVGAIFGIRSKKSASAAAAAGAAATSGFKSGLGRYPTATESPYLVPDYPSTVSFHR
jgi:hypothetical protein